MKLEKRLRIDGFSDYDDFGKVKLRCGKFEYAFSKGQREKYGIDVSSNPRGRHLVISLESSRGNVRDHREGNVTLSSRRSVRHEERVYTLGTITSRTNYVAEFAGFEIPVSRYEYSQLGKVPMDHVFRVDFRVE